ncbi:hypothetical protein [Nocardia salmonicida]|uniref:hypothetical protein n=1 Tax=Nocardia salmonicida TaxID=53431 RepID=UPI0033FFFD6C
MTEKLACDGGNSVGAEQIEHLPALVPHRRAAAESSTSTTVLSQEPVPVRLGIRRGVARLPSAR